MVRDHRLANGLRDEDQLATWERFQHQGGQVAILAKKQQIPLVQGVSYVFAVSIDNVGVGDYGDPVVFAAFGGFDSVHAEAAGETRDTPENAFKGLA